MADDKKLTMTRILRSYRKKIRRRYPNAQIDQEQLLACSVENFAKYLEERFEAGMTWGNYGKVWQVVNTNSPHSEEVQSRYRYDAYVPTFTESLGTERASTLTHSGDGEVDDRRFG
jgi:hypothetical protein